MTITIADGRGALWQWDTGRRLRVGSGVEQIHYQNRALGCSVDVDVGTDGTAIIPDELLQDCHTLTAYAYVTDDTGAYTMVQQDFIVHKRAKPAGYVYTPTEQMTLQMIQRQIGDLADLTTEAKDTLVAAINEAARTGGGAGSMDLRVADGYIQYSTDSGSTWQNLIDVAELKGADGSKGDPGIAGQDGHSPVVTATKSGKTTTISVDGAAIATVEDGVDGKPGAAGAPGKDGAGMDITGATVGQIAKITAVDASGVPTAWGPVDMPSGGSTDAVLYTAQTLTFEQKQRARKNIEAAASEWPTITGAVSLCPANITDSNDAVHVTVTKYDGTDYTATLDCGPENELVRVKGIRTPTDADTNAAATVEYVKAKVASGGITPHIGDNGNWFLGTTDTGKPSRGEKGYPGATGKSAYQYAQDGGYTGTETEFAEKLAQEQLIGTTAEITPTQVYNAVSAGVPVKVQHTDSTYGLLSFTAFNVAESLNVIVSQTIVYNGGVYILAELVGYKHNNRWGFMTTTLAQKTDIPSSLKNPNALTIKIGSTTVTYDGSTAQTVTIDDGTEVSY